MANYYRITGYCPKYDFSVIVESYGKFEKKWQFSSDVLNRGIEIIDVSDIDNVIDIDINRLTEEEPQKFVIRSYATGRPSFITKTIGGIDYKAIQVGEKTYIPKKMA